MPHSFSVLCFAGIALTLPLSLQALAPKEAERNQEAPHFFRNFALSEVLGQERKKNPHRQVLDSPRFGARPAQAIAPGERLTVKLPAPARRFSVALMPPVASTFEMGVFF